MALGTEDRGLSTHLRKHYGGRDATDHLKESPPPKQLQRLLEMDHLVVAKLVRDAALRIAPGELRKHDRLPASKAARRARPAEGDVDWRVWVSVPAEEAFQTELVYDVTGTMPRFDFVPA